MTYRLGVDVGGTFTDFLLLNEDTGETKTAKVPSTPEDSSIGVLNGVAKICDSSGIDPADIKLVMHGTTVATNAVLTGRGAKVGLITTSGFEDTLQVARSFCPGGLGGWVTFVKKPCLRHSSSLSVPRTNCCRWIGCAALDEAASGVAENRDVWRH